MIHDFGTSAYPSLLAVSVSLEEISTLVPVIVVTIETVHRSLRGVLARAASCDSVNCTLPQILQTIYYSTNLDNGLFFKRQRMQKVSEAAADRYYVISP